jgi:hypothetical protein
MLMTLVVVLVLLWALGVLGGTTMGGFVHVLLAAAALLTLARIAQRHRPVQGP